MQKRFILTWYLIRLEYPSKPFPHLLILWMVMWGFIKLYLCWIFFLVHGSSGCDNCMVGGWFHLRQSFCCNSFGSCSPLFVPLFSMSTSIQGHQGKNITFKWYYLSTIFSSIIHDILLFFFIYNSSLNGLESFISPVTFFRKCIYSVLLFIPLCLSIYL